MTPSGRPQLTLYNTLTRTKEPFAPIDASNVRVYTCGPTVYDYAHVGNARSAVVFDLLFRVLRHVFGEEHVTYVRNLTDVDDKINARALDTHGEAIAAGTISLNEAIREVTEKTAQQYQHDMAALGCLPPTVEPRATEFVLPRSDGKPDMSTMIQTLLDKGHAYVAAGSQGREVLFRVRSMEDYGALSGRNLEDQKAGARVAVEAHKEDAADFVLWKESTPSEPGWDGVFNGETIHGRPGWHIECSAMSEAYLGQTFDIHCGGLDLIFPHHENEIAQSRCCHGSHAMANVWMHNGFLQADGEKMSKSLGNFHTVNELLETPKVGGRSWPGIVVRLAMLMTHYREPIDLTVNRLEEAENIIAKLRRKAAPEAQAEDVHPGFLEELANDLDCTAIVRTLSQLDGRSLTASAALVGLDVKPVETSFDVAPIVAERLAHIKAKNWAEADRLRDDLLSKGIQLKDGKDANTGERTTTWEVVG
ncbi:MAG: cysteine--tRNA ligase [Pseudomonadota bacterium]